LRLAFSDVILRKSKRVSAIHSVHRWRWQLSSICGRVGFFQLRSILLTAFSVAAAIAVFTPSGRAQNLVTNGSFESPFIDGQFASYQGIDAVSLSSWVVDQVGTSVDHIAGLWQDADGSQSMDLNGTEAGSIYQDLATTAAQQYKIRFALAGNPFGIENKRLEVRWDGAQIADLTFVQSVYGTDNMGWTYHEFVATAGDNSTRLTFNSLTPAMQGEGGFVFAWYGPALDDVSVTPIPEPSMLMLSLAGLFLIPAARLNCHRRAR
jgi:choice-of-anchor C domain-containing protein